MGRHPEPVAAGQKAQGFHIARAASAKVPVFPHGNLRHAAGGAELPDEFLRAHGSQPGGKFQRQHHLHPQLFHQGELFRIHRHNGRRHAFRADTGQRMSAERQHGGNASVTGRAFHRCGNHSGMPQVQPVKHPHGPVHGGRNTLQFLKLPVNDHAATWQSECPPAPPGKAWPGTALPWGRFSGYPP